MIQPVILCGGKGSRLWPLSRTLYPKQFIEVSEGRYLFGEALQRTKGFEDSAAPIVICNEVHRFLAAEEMRKQSVEGQLVLEPTGRNTAPAVAVAAFLVEEADPVMFVSPADHAINDNKSLTEAVNVGYSRAMEGHIVTMGVKPSHPNTGYGYIRKGEKTKSGAFSVRQFVEKPDLETAERFVASKEYFWNSGIFVFKASRYLEELQKHAPAIYDACKAAVAGKFADLDFVRLDKAAFESSPSDSIDYAVMEKVSDIEVVPFEQDWLDLGTWNSLHEVHPKDDASNSLLGDVVAEDTRNCYVRSSDRLIVTLGLEDTTVVETKDAILVAPHNKLDGMKKVIDRLKREGRTEVTAHKIDYRPWGSFESLVVADRFQVKRIIVKPGEVLSLQKHFHRAEHWVVVKGTAKIVNGETESILSEDQSTYIPLGNVHRLENPGKIPLELIEVQTGSYLGEDDIIRFEDKYKR